MRYGEILKRAWNVTWRHKALWVLGLFAGGLGSGGSGNSGFQTDSTSWPFGEPIDPVWDAPAEQMLPFLLMAIVVLLFIGLAWWAASLAARAGLVHLVEESEEGREVRLGPGWSHGFGRWGRMFVLDLVLFLPLLAIGLVAGAILFASVSAGAFDTGADPLGAIAGVCGLIGIFALIALTLGAVLDALRKLGERYIALDDRRGVEAIVTAWETLKRRFKDVALMWLIMFAVGIGAGMAVGALGLLLIAPVVFGALATGQPWLFVLVLPALLVMMVPTSIANTFLSASWTAFFRDLEGRSAPVEEVAPVTAPVPEPPASWQAPIPDGLAPDDGPDATADAGPTPDAGD